MNYEQWRAFYDHKNGDVYDGWGDQLTPYFTQLGITCTIAFRYHHNRLKYSRKKNSNLFSARGHCKAEMCPVQIDISIEDAPKKKGQPCVFKAVITGDKNHNSRQKTASRPLTGATREAIGML